MSQEENFEEKFGDLLDDIFVLLRTERNKAKIPGGRIVGDLLELTPPSTLAVVGDLHGDLRTLRKILSHLEERAFFGAPDNKVIFLGDYVDRGTRSIDVLYSLLKLKCDYPDIVILTRGNHEAPLDFPFRQHDLPSDLEANFFAGRRLYEKILSVFNQLTTAAFIKDHIMF